MKTQSMGYENEQAKMRGSERSGRHRAKGHRPGAELAATAGARVCIWQPLKINLILMRNLPTITSADALRCPLTAVK